MIHIMNSNMMPKAGVYHSRQVELGEFVREFVVAVRVHGMEWRSYVGYPQTAGILSEAFQIAIPVSREQKKLESGDTMFAVRLKYRVAPVEKGQPQHGSSVEDYEFFITSYKEN